MAKKSSDLLSQNQKLTATNIALKEENKSLVKNVQSTNKVRASEERIVKAAHRLIAGEVRSVRQNGQFDHKSWRDESKLHDIQYRQRAILQGGCRLAHQNSCFRKEQR